MTEAADDARGALDRFIEAWNAADIDAVRATLNYPHVTFGSAGTVVIASTPESFTASFERLRTTEGWHRSAIESFEVLGGDEGTVHCAVELARYREDGTRYASGRIFYIVTRVDGHWGMQFRTPLEQGTLTSGR